LQLACDVGTEVEPTERPAGWTDETHGNKATPDYAVVFPEDVVGRLDITIAASDWQAMQDDMTAKYGEFGQSRGWSLVSADPGDLPAAPGGRDAACDGLQEGDACTVSFNGVATTGTCTPMMNDQLACMATGVGNVPPGGQDDPGAGGMSAALVEACADLQEGDACAVSLMGMTIEGTCASDAGGQLACVVGGGPGGGDMSDGMAEACANLAEGDACSVSFGETTVEGTCTAGEGDQLLCRTQGAPGGSGFVTSDDENPVYVPCALEFAGKTWWYVGIRFKGQSSLTSTWSAGIYKLPLRLDFDQFEDEYPQINNQRFYGFKELTLASNWSDSSYLREKVAHDIFRAAGVPAPRTAFYRVYIDHGDGPVYFGLYTMTEIPASPMLTAQFGDDSGNLYKPTSTWATFREDDFDKETNENEADFSDVQAAIAALNADRSDAAAWRAGLEAVLNVDGFLRWLAVNTVIQNWDTYGNMAQNYYLYGNPDDGGRLSWIPWDNNMALASGMGVGGAGGGGGMGGALSLSLAEVSEQWPLIRYLADDPVYWNKYVAHVREAIDGAFAVEATQARYQAEHDLIAPYVVGTEGEQAGYTLLSGAEEFERGLEELFTHVEARREAVLEFLQTTP